MTVSNVLGSVYISSDALVKSIKGSRVSSSNSVSFSMSSLDKKHTKKKYIQYKYKYKNLVSRDTNSAENLLTIAAYSHFEL